MNEICIKTLSSVFKNWICYLEFICVVHLEFALVSLTLFKTSPDISGSWNWCSSAISKPLLENSTYIVHSVNIQLKCDFFKDQFEAFCLQRLPATLVILRLIPATTIPITFVHGLFLTDSKKRFLWNDSSCALWHWYVYPNVNTFFDRSNQKFYRQTLQDTFNCGHSCIYINNLLF